MWNGTINVIVALKLDKLTCSVYDVEKLMKIFKHYIVKIIDKEERV